VIERLCQAVNEIHDRGNVLEALEPGRIEVGADDQCDVSGAAKGSPRPPYAPPEGGGVATAPADVYAAGAISWEILAGRPVGRPPSHLAEVRPDLSRELADAVMACLEQSPDWRPNDLTYLAQMAAARQRAAGSHTAPRAVEADVAASGRPGRGSGPGGGRRPAVSGQDECPVLACRLQAHHGYSAAPDPGSHALPTRDESERRWRRRGDDRTARRAGRRHPEHAHPSSARSRCAGRVAGGGRGRCPGRGRPGAVEPTGASPGASGERRHPLGNRHAPSPDPGDARDRA